MIKSMTAYGRAEHCRGDNTFVAEIRSLNSRYREIVLRMPKNLLLLEKELKAIISSRIARGRIEVSIQRGNTDEQVLYDIELNVPLVNAYLRIFKQLGEQFGFDPGVRAETLCQMKDVIIVKPEEVDLEGLKPGFEDVLTLALDSLDVMRNKEGEAIETDLNKRLRLLNEYVDEVAQAVPQLVEGYRTRLEENIHRLLGDVVVDENRLTQEIVIYSERSDITEEIVRIRSHIKQFQAYLCVDEAVGRRLDFLVQEMNREVNTLSVKASDFIISKIAVEMKGQLEKIREQVQNVE